MAAVRKTPTTANFGPNITGTNYADKVNAEVSALWDRVFHILESVSGTNTILATCTPALTGYAKNQGWGLIPAVTNTGPTQINISGQGLRNIKTAMGAALVGGELVAGVLTPLVDVGTELWMVPTVIATVNSPLAIFSLTKAVNVAGGTATSGSRQTYPLNTTVLNEIVGASLIGGGGDQFKINLPIGTYEVDAEMTIQMTDSTACFLRDQTAGADIAGLARIVTEANNGSNTYGWPVSLSGKFSLTVASIVILQYRCQTTRAADGLGTAGNIGETESYGYIKFKKVT